MEQARQRIPLLTPEQLADPRTKVIISGLEFELWQVAKMYDLDYPMPSRGERTGATAKDVRKRFRRQRDQGATSSSRASDTPAGPVPEGQPWPDSPTLPTSVPIRRPYSVARQSNGHGPDTTQDLIDFITRMMEEFRVAEQEGTEDATTASASSRSTTPRASHAVFHPPPLFVNPPFSRSPQPPPNRPLPPPPAQLATARHHPSTTSTSNSRAARKLPEPSKPERDIDATSERTFATTATRGSEPEGNSDSGSERTIMPATSRQQHLPGPSEQTTASTTAREQPVAASREQNNTPAAAQQKAPAVRKELAVDAASWQQHMQALREQTAALKARQQLLFGVRQEQSVILAERRQLSVASPGECAVTALAAQEQPAVVPPQDRTITPAMPRQQPTITPRTRQHLVPASAQQVAAREVSRQQPVGPTRGQELSVPRVRPAVRRPAANRDDAGRAPPVSILRNCNEGRGTWLAGGQNEVGSSEPPRRQLQPSRMPHPLPQYDFLNHPPDFSQQPIHDQPAMMARTRPSPPPMNRFRSMTNLLPSDSSQRTARDEQARIGTGASPNRFFSASSTLTPSIPPAFPQQAPHDRRLGTMNTASSPQLNKSRSPSKLARPSPDSLQNPASPFQQSQLNQKARVATGTSPPSSKSRSSSNDARTFAKFLKKRPSFLNRPPDFSQQPSQVQKPGPSMRTSPSSRTDKTSPSQNRAADKPTPVTPTKDDDDEQPKSHWSDSDSEAELTRMQRVKRVLSFARLRPKKSQALQSQSGNQGSKSSTSIGNRTSWSSGTDRTRSNSKGGK